MRRSWLIAFTALPLALSSYSALAQRVDYDRDARRWTLTSGSVTYQLAQRHSLLVLDYFGPASQTTNWGKTVSPEPRYDLAGVADGKPLEPSSRARDCALDAEWRSSVIEIDEVVETP